jgi:hypothetical protein
MKVLSGPMGEGIVIAETLASRPVADVRPVGFLSDNLLAVASSVVLAFAALGLVALTYRDCTAPLSPCLPMRLIAPFNMQLRAAERPPAPPRPSLAR